MKTYRNSLEKHNAPFRGVSKKSDFVNHQMAATHDMLEIFNVSGGNNNIIGHKQINQNNLSAIINGDKNITTKNSTAGTIKKVTKHLKDLSDLSKWEIPHLTYGEVIKNGPREWTLIPPEKQKGFFELEHLLTVQRGQKLLIRFKPIEWDPNTIYSFGELQYSSSGESTKDLKVDEFNNFSKVSNSYFEHILRFDEEKDVRLIIKTKNKEDGTLGTEPLKMIEFGVYEIEETEVYVKSLEDEIKPKVNDAKLVLLNLEKRSV